MAQRHLGAGAVEPHAVDDARVLFETDLPRPRIARLRQWRDRADLDEAEAEPQQRVRHLGVLVETRRHPDRVWKVEPEGTAREYQTVRLRARHRKAAQALDGKPMRIFRIELAQQGQRQMVESTDHCKFSGSRWRPSSPSTSVTMFSAAAGSNSPYRWGNRSPPREDSHFNASPSASASTASSNNPV